MITRDGVSVKCRSMYVHHHSIVVNCLCVCVCSICLGLYFRLIETSCMIEKEGVLKSAVAFVNKYFLCTLAVRILMPQCANVEL